MAQEAGALTESEERQLLKLEKKAKTIEEGENLPVSQQEIDSLNTINQHLRNHYLRGQGEGQRGLLQMGKPYAQTFHRRLQEETTLSTQGIIDEIAAEQRKELYHFFSEYKKNGESSFSEAYYQSFEKKWQEVMGKWTPAPSFSDLDKILDLIPLDSSTTEALNPAEQMLQQIIKPKSATSRWDFPGEMKLSAREQALCDRIWKSALRQDPINLTEKEWKKLKEISSKLGLQRHKIGVSEMPSYLSEAWFIYLYARNESIKQQLNFGFH